MSEGYGIVTPMNKETTFVYDNHPMFELLYAACSNYSSAVDDLREIHIELCCRGFDLVVKRIYSDLEKTTLIAYEILDYAVVPL